MGGTGDYKQFKVEDAVSLTPEYERVLTQNQSSAVAVRNVDMARHTNTQSERTPAWPVVAQWVSRRPGNAEVARSKHWARR